MKCQYLILLVFFLSCHENKMVETPMMVPEETLEMEDPKPRAWEEEIEKQLTAASLSHKITVQELIGKMKLHHAVKGVQMTKSGFLYISVSNDGLDKNPTAIRLCRVARRFELREIKGVKIIDVRDARFYDNQTASGTQLGIAACSSIQP